MRRDPRFKVTQLLDVPRLDPSGTDPFPGPSGPFIVAEDGIDSFEGEILEVVDCGCEGEFVD
jgi:hypothetical protein